ncbi:hypothetical protein KUCAC02_026546, partial [Chaenocephalus aceratus]
TSGEEENSETISGDFFRITRTQMDVQCGSDSPSWLIGDRDSHCGVICSRTQGKPVKAGLKTISCRWLHHRLLQLRRETWRSKACKFLQTRITHFLSVWMAAPQQQQRLIGLKSSMLEGLPLSPVDVSDAGQSKCRVERNQALEQSRRPQESIFIPECNEDGTFAQVQCHTLTGYCWCVTSDGKPVSGSSAHNRTPGVQ